MLQLITPPAAEPIHLTEALAQIKQDQGNDDAHVSASITAARVAAENRTWRTLICSRYKQVLDSFPGIGVFNVPWGHIQTVPRNCIVLERAPVQVVESIQYLDMSGTTQTVDPSLYTIDYASEPPRITPKFGQIWPIPLPQIASVWFTFLAGYAGLITADETADTITVSLWKTLAVGDAVTFSNSGGALPSPLQPLITYYIQSVVSAGVYKLSATSGGAAIDLTGNGVGLNFIGAIPGDIMAWMKMRIGSIDMFREEAIAMTRGKIMDLPYVDSLLDAYSTWW